MDNNNVIFQFDQIETKVENLIKRCSSLESQNFELAEKVKSLEAELEQKIEIEHQYSEQKTLIRSKVDNILEKLNHIDSNSVE